MIGHKRMTNSGETTMTKIMRYLIFCLIALLPMGAKCYAQGGLNKHAAAGVNCEECHIESTSYSRTANDVCLKCHGSYADLAMQTAHLRNIKNAIQNPHDSHIGDARCTICHKNHDDSVLYCNQCHSPKFDMQVP